MSKPTIQEMRALRVATFSLKRPSDETSVYIPAKKRELHPNLLNVPLYEVDPPYDDKPMVQEVLSLKHPDTCPAPSRKRPLYEPTTPEYNRKYTKPVSPAYSPKSPIDITLIDLTGDE